MDKRIAALLGAVAGLATLGSAQAATPAPNASEALQASSYADLLAPIADAGALLKADDAARSQAPQPGVKLAQYYGRYYHHHHHHHHHHHRRTWWYYR